MISSVDSKDSSLMIMQYPSLCGNGSPKDQLHIKLIALTKA